MILLLFLFIGTFYFLWNVIFRGKTLSPTYKDKTKKCVLISGCDTGFGNLLARRLDEMGYEVIAACFNMESEGAKRLLEETRNLHIIEMDVSKEESVKEGVKKTGEICGERGLWAVVNNAGINRGMSTDLTPIRTFQEVLAVNYFGVVLLTQESLPLLKKRRGRIVNVASIAGRVGAPVMPAYCSSKYAVEGFSDSLRREMLAWGITVSIIEPGFMRTVLTTTIENCVSKCVGELPKEKREEYGEDFFREQTEKIQKINLGDPGQVIEEMVHALTNSSPKTHYIVGFDAQVLQILTLLPGRFIDFFISLRMPVPKRALDPSYWTEY